MYTGNLIGGRYRVTRRIGAGAIGVVWEAEDTQSERRVALKQVLHAAPEHQRRLLKEARVCQRLSHPNIIEVLDVGQTERGVPFLVMPLLSGETIAEMLVRKRKLAVPLAARIARDIANALDAAHEEGIIHRDLKPANVFIHRADKSESPIVKVLDFGVCKDVNAKTTVLTAQGHVIGSPAYMSPEQVKGMELDARTDIWSLGVLLFEMITGVRPFRGQGVELFVNILGAEVPTISQLVRSAPEGLASLVSQCLTRDRDRRINSATEVAAALEEFVNLDGTSTLTETSCNLLATVVGDRASTGAIGSSAQPASDPAFRPPMPSQGAPEPDPLLLAVTTPLHRHARTPASPLTREADPESAFPQRGTAGTELLRKVPGARPPSSDWDGALPSMPSNAFLDGAPPLSTETLLSAPPAQPAVGAAARGPEVGGGRAGAPAVAFDREGSPAGRPRASDRARPLTGRGPEAPLDVVHGGTVLMAPALPSADCAKAPIRSDTASGATTLPLLPRDRAVTAIAAQALDPALSASSDVTVDLPRSTWLAIGAGAVALAVISLGVFAAVAAPSRSEPQAVSVPAEPLHLTPPPPPRTIEESPSAAPPTPPPPAEEPSNAAQPAPAVKKAAAPPETGAVARSSKQAAAKAPAMPAPSLFSPLSESKTKSTSSPAPSSAKLTSSKTASPCRAIGGCNGLGFDSKKPR
jgi:serine/threonine-protein kinase